MTNPATLFRDFTLPTGAEQYIQHRWKFTLDSDVSNVQPDLMLIP